jgi:hypothetical protein
MENTIQGIEEKAMPPPIPEMALLHILQNREAVRVVFLLTMRNEEWWYVDAA